MAKTPESLYLEREKRVTDATELKKPDTIPVLPMFGFFTAMQADEYDHFLLDPLDFLMRR